MRLADLKSLADYSLNCTPLSLITIRNQELKLYLGGSCK